MKQVDSEPFGKVEKSSSKPTHLGDSFVVRLIN